MKKSRNSPQPKTNLTQSLMPKVTCAILYIPYRLHFHSHSLNTRADQQERPCSGCCIQSSVKKRSAAPLTVSSQNSKSYYTLRYAFKGVKQTFVSRVSIAGNAVSTAMPTAPICGCLLTRRLAELTPSLVA